MTTALPETATLREFAVIGGFKPSYAHQLKRDDRLVLAPDGKTVRVAESLARIRDTRDPAKAAVAARHAADRAEGAGQADSATNAPHAANGAASAAIPSDAAAERIGSSYQAARAIGERYRAMSAKRDYEQSIGKLLDVDQVRAAITDAITTLRTRLEGLAPILGPQLAPVTDEARCTAIIAEAIEHALEELARQFKTIAPEKIT